jgi:hypothetical protein
LTTNFVNHFRKCKCSGLEKGLRAFAQFLFSSSG